VFFHNEHPLISGSLAAFEARLDPSIFFRASRRHILNLNCIKGAEMGAAGNLIVILRGGRQVELSRRQSSILREILSI
jgi:two-component system LytT family response regulator